MVDREKIYFIDEFEIQTNSVDFRSYGRSQRNNRTNKVKVQLRGRNRIEQKYRKKSILSYCKD